MVKYFTIEIHPKKPDKCQIKINFDKFKNISTKGSFNVLPARLMGISYANYCRMCRDIFDAEIIGKNELYPKVYFNNDRGLNLLLSILNKRMELIMILRESDGVSENILNQWRESYKEEFGTYPDYNLKELKI